MEEDRFNAVFDWILKMEDGIAHTMRNAEGAEGHSASEMPADTEEMSEAELSAFEETFIGGLLGDGEARQKFDEKLRGVIDGMPPDKQQWFAEPSHVIETLEGIFERYRADFTVKVAMGAMRHAAGETDIKNSGYQAGSTLVSETTKWALDLLTDTVCEGDAKRAMTLLGVTISCTMASMGDLTPKNEELMLPQIMRVEPQVALLSPKNRTPENIMRLIDEVSEQDWEQFNSQTSQKSHRELLEESRGRNAGGAVAFL